MELKFVYRVAEITPVYDLIPGDKADEWKPGPGWIYVTNELKTWVNAQEIIAVLKMQNPHRKFRIDTLEKEIND